MARSEENPLEAMTPATTDTFANETDDSNGGGDSSASQTAAPSEKPFKCPECSRGFRLQTQLNSHNEIVHLKRRPFACRVCNLDFSCRGNYTKHCETKNHQKKVQDLSESGAPVTPDMLLTGDALKAHLAQVKNEARNTAKTLKKSPSKSPSLATHTSLQPISSKKFTQSPFHSHNTSGDAAKNNGVKNELLACNMLSTSRSQVCPMQHHMGNGGTVTALQSTDIIPESMTKKSMQLNSYTDTVDKPSLSRKRLIDDVDEYERLVAELNACKSSLTEVQKHCKKLQVEKEKLENDHPAMRDKIDGLAEQVRFKSCLLKKLDGRKAAATHQASSTSNGDVNNAVKHAAPFAVSSNNSVTFSTTQSGGADSDCSPSTALSSPLYAVTTRLDAAGGCKPEEIAVSGQNGTATASLSSPPSLAVVKSEFVHEDYVNTGMSSNAVVAEIRNDDEELPPVASSQVPLG